jgi:tripartite-type tricarboxylate transporter receptor subunit TctC
MKIPAQLITFFAGILLAATGYAQTYPAKPILMIVPLQAGSAGD